MKTKNETSEIIKTWLPLFPGFYNTIFEPDGEDIEIDEINRIRTEKGLNKIEFDDCTFNYREYENRVSEAACNFIENELSQFLTSVNFEQLSSPKEYNFRNDSINCEIELTAENKKAIRDYIYTNIDEYKQYLKDNYTSCSGFISSYDNFIEGWQELTSNFNNYNNAHSLGSILQFICKNEQIEDIDMYYFTSENAYLSCENYNELTGE